MFKKLLIRAAAPLLSKALKVQPPVVSPAQTKYPTVPSLPGKKFAPVPPKLGSAQQGRGAELSLEAGDYLIPVNTFCLKAGASSPQAHGYTLSRLEGSRASVLKKLYSRVTRDDSLKEAQALTWAIQSGLPLEKMEKSSQALVRRLLREYEDELRADTLETLKERWNSARKKVPLLPRWDHLTSEILKALGPAGEWIGSFLAVREEIEERAADYETFASTVDRLGMSEHLGTSDTVPWSDLGAGTYARFLTQGSYGDPGWLEVRASQKAKLDITQLVADPGFANIQPLAFASLAVPAAAHWPALLAFIALAIALKNWDQLIDALSNIDFDRSPELEEAKKAAEQMLAQRHDELEKPLKDKRILDGAEKIKEKQTDAGARNYKKEGGREQLRRDFESLPGEAKNRPDGVRVKTMRNGDKAVERNRPRDVPPTLEMQPPGSTNIRVKVRYP